MKYKIYRSEVVGYNVPDFKSKRATAFGFGERNHRSLSSIINLLLKFQ